MRISYLTASNFLLYLVAISCGMENPEVSLKDSKRVSAHAEANNIILTGTVAFEEPLPNKPVVIQTFNLSDGTTLETEYSTVTDSQGNYQMVVPDQFNIGGESLNLIEETSSLIKIVVKSEGNTPTLSSVLNLGDDGRIKRSSITIFSTFIEQEFSSTLTENMNDIEGSLSVISKTIYSSFEISESDSMEDDSNIIAKAKVIGKIIASIEKTTDSDFETIVDSFVKSLIGDESDRNEKNSDGPEIDFKNIVESSKKIVAAVEGENIQEILDSELSNEGSGDEELADLLEKIAEESEQNTDNGESSSSESEEEESSQAAADETAEETTENPLACVGDALNGIPYANAATGANEDESILICTKEQFFYLTNNEDEWVKSFKLGKNIDLSFYDSSSPELALKPVGFDGDAFEGVFDGNGFKILNASYSSESLNKSDHIGIFGLLEGTVKNLFVEGLSITGEDYLGFIGLMENEAVISNSRISNINISGDNLIGGMVGKNDGGLISKVKVEEVIINAVGDKIGGLVGENKGGIDQSAAIISLVLGDKVVGGLVGKNQGDISNSYATGSIGAIDEILGGLIGEHNGMATNNLSLSTVYQLTEKMGGFSGKGNKPEEYLNNLWAGDLADPDEAFDLLHFGENGSDEVEVNQIEVKNSEDLKNQDIYIAHGFDDQIWELSESNEFPTLKWE